MTGLLLIAHEPLATALESVARHVYPDCANRLRALDVPPGMAPDSVRQQAQVLMRDLGHDDVLVLTDVFGATPCNAAERLEAPHNIRVLTGLNVPMLWRALCYSELPLEQVAERALAGATQGAMPVGLVRPSRQTFTFGDLSAHDPDPHHHQQ